VLNLALQLAINAATLLIAFIVFPGLAFTGDPPALLLLAAIFGVINTFLKPVLKLAALPFNLLTFGLFGLAVNGGLLLLLAFVSSVAGLKFSVGGYPPDFSAWSIGTAIVGGLVIAVVSTVLSLVFDRGR
jgi:putative membrane protein